MAEPVRRDWRKRRATREVHSELPPELAEFVKVTSETIIDLQRRLADIEGRLSKADKILRGAA